MEFINQNTIKLEREFNELDRLVFEFVNVLKKHADYVIISAYVSILFGRTRTTEDIDIFVKELSKEDLERLYEDLGKAGFWCINAESIETIYEYLSKGTAVRFAKKGQSIPNFEIKFALKEIDLETFKDLLVVQTELGQLNISSLERQIAFKKYYLRSSKDVEDAEFIEELFKDKIDKDKVNKYRLLIEGK